MSLHTHASDYTYLVHRTIVGAILLVRSRNEICSIYLADTEEELQAVLAKKFQSGHPPPVTALDAARLIEWLEHLLNPESSVSPQTLDIRGTPFQKRVWTYLMTIPRGETRTYSQVAQAIGQPTATRAVARACACNEISLAIPCHRVIHANGGKMGYRWGVSRKEALLALERQ